MPISKTPQIAPFPAWSIDQKEPSVQRYLPLPTAESIKNGALFGIPLKSNLTQQELPDETIQNYINEAISQIEHALDLYITPVEFSEKYDYDRHHFTWNYNYLKLNHPNVLYVSSVELSFSNNAVPGFVQFPLEHVHVMPQEGVIQLVPAFGTSLSGFLLSAFSGTQFHALRAIGMTNFPGGVRVKYTCGFEQDKVPAVLVGLIETIAALRILSILGPLIFPHNAVSINTDGVSQSTSTLGPGFLRQRMDELEKQRDQYMDAAKGYYQRKFLVDFF
jgi:hypothetical protein